MALHGDCKAKGLACKIRSAIWEEERHAKGQEVAQSAKGEDNGTKAQDVQPAPEEVLPQGKGVFDKSSRLGEVLRHVWHTDQPAPRDCDHSAGQFDHERR